jgi:hypothetical protein
VFSNGGAYGLNLHSSVYFSPDGEKVLFSHQTQDPLAITMCCLEQLDGVWGKPQEFPPPEDYGVELVAAPDGRRLYFLAEGTAEANGSPPPDLWFIDRTDSGWSAPYSLAEITQDQGSIYFSADLEGGQGDLDVYRARFVDGHYAKPENVGPPVNTGFSDSVLCVAPGERFLILYRFSSTDRSVRGSYVAFRLPDDSWSEPVHLDKEFGFGLAFDASLSPDGRYLFILDRGVGVYWVDVRGIDALRPEP